MLPPAAIVARRDGIRQSTCEAAKAVSATLAQALVLEQPKLLLLPFAALLQIALQAFLLGPLARTLLGAALPFGGRIGIGLQPRCRILLRQQALGTGDEKGYETQQIAAVAQIEPRSLIGIAPLAAPIALDVAIDVIPAHVPLRLGLGLGVRIDGTGQNARPAELIARHGAPEHRPLRGRAIAPRLFLARPAFGFFQACLFEGPPLGFQRLSAPCLGLVGRPARPFLGLLASADDFGLTFALGTGSLLYPALLLGETGAFGGRLVGLSLALGVLPGLDLLSQSCRMQIGGALDLLPRLFPERQLARLFDFQ
ncbi:MAG: hypothetical protein AB7O63_14195, partial [Reyranellaceae bacterium]